MCQKIKKYNQYILEHFIDEHLKTCLISNICVLLSLPRHLLSLSPILKHTPFTQEEPYTYKGLVIHNTFFSILTHQLNGVATYSPPEPPPYVNHFYHHCKSTYSFGSLWATVLGTAQLLSWALLWYIGGFRSWSHISASKAVIQFKCNKIEQ